MGDKRKIYVVVDTGYTSRLSTSELNSPKDFQDAVQHATGFSLILTYDRFWSKEKPIFYFRGKASDHAELVSFLEKEELTRGVAVFQSNKCYPMEESDEGRKIVQSRHVKFLYNFLDLVDNDSDYSYCCMFRMFRKYHYCDDKTYIVNGSKLFVYHVDTESG